MNIRSDFGNAMKALIQLLRCVKEQRWIEVLESQYETWIHTGDASSHRSLYGGMGSFNDFSLSQSNLQLSEEQEPFADQLFNDLKTLCYIFSTGKSFTRGEVEAQLETVNSNLQGWRCRRCGHAEVTLKEKDAFLAYRLVRQAILDAVVEGSLPQCVERLLSLQIPGLKNARNECSGQIRRSQINIVRRTGWMQPCPVCQSNQTCVYRWIQMDGEEFLPAQDNLRMISQ
ncbi:MAG: hypothetical protein V1799_08680 [bacterium]